MATGGTSDLCDICNAKHQLSVAVKWCPECEEKLCEGCHQHHSVAKISKHHVVIEIKNYKSFPESNIEIRNFCNQHDMKFSNFCPQHDELCCPECSTGSGQHSECKTLLLQNVIKTANTSALLRSTETRLKSLQKYIAAIIQDRKTNIQLLHEQRQEIVKEIKQTKEKILKQLEVMERKIKKDITSRVRKNTTQLESEIADLEERLRKSENLLKSSSALLDFGSDVQTYIGSKSIEAEVAQQINYLQDLINDGSLKRLGLKIERNPKDEITVGISKLFGTVLDEVSSVSFTLTSDFDKHAKIMSLPPAVSFDDIKLSLMSSFKLSGKYNIVNGCSFILQDRIVVANCDRSCITILKENGEMEKEIRVSSRPQDVTVVDNNTMAVSCDEGVKIININSGEIENSIPTGDCTGVEYYNGSLICCVPGKGVKSVDLKSNNLTTLVHDTECYQNLYCAVYKDHIFLSRYIDHTITCYSMNGDQLWEYEDTSIISRPFGIAVDSSSNVYVASYNNDTVVVLSPDGKRSRTLLTRYDGLNGPTALHFNRENNQLIVFNEGGSGFLFKI